MKIKIYRKIHKFNEFVDENDAKEYALTELGLMENGRLVIIPRGKNGEYTIEQLENIDSTVEWFFSGDWFEDEINEDIYV